MCVPLVSRWPLAGDGNFGGLTPAISTALVKLTGDKSSPGWWLMCAALCGLAATAMLFVRLSRGYIAAENKA